MRALLKEIDLAFYPGAPRHTRPVKPAERPAQQSVLQRAELPVQHWPVGFAGGVTDCVTSDRNPCYTSVVVASADSTCSSLYSVPPS